MYSKLSVNARMSFWCAAFALAAASFAAEPGYCLTGEATESGIAS